VTPGNRENVCAGEVIPLELYSAHRSITNPYHDALVLLRGVIGAAYRRVATDGLGSPPFLSAASDAAGVILRLRKRKDEDEIGEIRHALHYCAVAYSAARQVIAPGLTEIDVYNAMNAAVIGEAGTVIPFRGDFACGERGIKEGGPPTRRKILAGDLYILDLFPAPALYFGDTCRTFAVSEPTSIQYQAWSLVRQAVALAEAMVRPGVAAREVHTEVKRFLDAHELTEGSFWHHTGHGIGHRGHEAPRIIAESEDVFEVGDVITLEPGVYTSALQGGIRLEDNYVVGETGIENLFDFPMELR
jgi:Xaa-Pro aminopeptidase